LVLHDETPAFESAYRVESVDRALRLLWLLRDRGRIGVSEASDHLGVARSTAHRLLTTLQEQRFVAQDPTTRRYVAGRALLEIGLAALANLDVRRVARPEIEALVREVRETVQLMILQGPRTLVVDSVECDQVLRISARTGGSMPPHCVSGGKALLALMDPAAVRQLLGAEPLATLTDQSISTYAELDPELEHVRNRGYAGNFSESEAGQTAVAVTIPVPLGMTPAAITVAAPSMRLVGRRIPVVVAAAQATAERIGQRLQSER
jgi:DNA-binding IclR family transcriptional regulator